MKIYKPHPAAELFHMMPEVELLALSQDIATNGQHHPVIVTRAGLMLDGRNRQEACRLAGIEVEAVMWMGEEDGDSPTAYVLSVNRNRRHLTPDQAAAAAVKALPMFEKEAKERQRRSAKPVETTKPAPKGSAPVALPSPAPVKKKSEGKAAAVAAKALGASTRKVERAKWLAKTDPVRFEKVADGSLSLKKAEKQVKHAEQLVQIKAYVPPEGRFGLVTTDFSWLYRDGLDGSDAIRGAPPYPPMTVEEIVEFIRTVLAAKCDEICLLASWVTNPILLDLATWPIVQTAIEALGFRPRQIRTWTKTESDGGPFTGLGTGMRNDTEHLVVFTRGKVVFNEMGEAHGRPIQRTSFSAPKGEHSEKPAKVYTDLAQLVPYTARLEMFARDINGVPSEREGWVTSGAEKKPTPEKREGWVAAAEAKDPGPDVRCRFGCDLVIATPNWKANYAAMEAHYQSAHLEAVETEEILRGAPGSSGEAEPPAAAREAEVSEALTAEGGPEAEALRGGALITSILSRHRDSGEQRRIVATWKDPEVSTIDLKKRFGLSPEDIDKLKLELGARPKPGPLSPWWRAERTRRHRRGWA